MCTILIFPKSRKCINQGSINNSAYSHSRKGNYTYQVSQNGNASQSESRNDNSRNVSNYMNNSIISRNINVGMTSKNTKKVSGYSDILQKELRKSYIQKA